MIVAKAEMNYYPDQALERKVVEEKKQINKNRRRKKSKARFKLFGMLLTLFFSTFSLFILLGYANISRAGLDISQLEKDRNQLIEEKAALVADLEAIKSSRRIGDEATTKLGMAPPKKSQVIYISLPKNTENVAKTGGVRAHISKSLNKITGVFSSLF